jgi:hypothetical protein
MGAVEAGLAVFFGGVGTGNEVFGEEDVQRRLKRGWESVQARGPAGRAGHCPHARARNVLGRAGRWPSRPGRSCLGCAGTQRAYWAGTWSTLGGLRTRMGRPGWLLGWRAEGGKEVRLRGPERPSGPGGGVLPRWARGRLGRRRPRGGERKKKAGASLLYFYILLFFFLFYFLLPRTEFLIKRILHKITHQIKYTLA